MKTPVFFSPPTRYVLAQYDYDFIILGTLSTGNKAIERQEAQELNAALMQFPLFQENVDGQHEAMKDILMSYGKRNMDNYGNSITYNY